MHECQEFVHKQLTLFSLMDGREHRKTQKTIAKKQVEDSKEYSFIPSASLYPVN